MRPIRDQGSFFGVRIRLLASEGGSFHKYTNQSQSLRILQPEKRTLLETIKDRKMEDYKFSEWWTLRHYRPLHLPVRCQKELVLGDLWASLDKLHRISWQDYMRKCWGDLGTRWNFPIQIELKSFPGIVGMYLLLFTNVAFYRTWSILLLPEWYESVHAKCNMQFSLCTKWANYWYCNEMLKLCTCLCNCILHQK
jgi:hypothetical protein